MKTKFNLNGNEYELFINEEEITNERGYRRLGMRYQYNNYGDYVMMDVFSKDKTSWVNVYVYLHNITKDEYSQTYREVEHKQKRTIIKEMNTTKDIVKYFNINEEEINERKDNFYKIYFE